MAPNSNTLAAALSESEAHVDDEGYATDDEGNRWFVGKRFAGGTYRPRDLPPPAEPPKPKHAAPATDNAKRIEAFQKLPAAQRDGSFGKSILSQLRDGRSLTEPQRKAVRQMFYRARLRDLADLFR